ncbi:unnamed protein product, partial [Polarella glacialis]
MSAVKIAREAGLPPVELEQAEQSLNLTLRRRLQRRQAALCGLQAALEAAPKDESFGTSLRKALDEARAEGAVQHLSGGREAAEAAEAAMRDWELAEQQRGEARMALQFALRRGEASALEVALNEARDAGLSDGDEPGLIAEA